MSRIQDLYNKDSSKSFGHTPNGVKNLLNCVKTGWTYHPKYAAMGELNFYAGLSDLFFGPISNDGLNFNTFVDNELKVLNGDNQYRYNTSATWLSNMIPSVGANTSMGSSDNAVYKDFACYINPDNIIKMSDLKNTYYMRDDLIYVPQYSEIDVSKKVTGGSENTAIACESISLCCPSTFNGADTFTDSNTALSVSSTYDDWIIVTGAELYARKDANSGARTRVYYPPFVDAKLNGLNCLAFEPKKSGNNKYYKTTGGIVSAKGRVLQRFSMPNFVLNKNSFCYYPSLYYMGNENMQFYQTLNISGNRAYCVGYPWGRFNVCTSLSKSGSFKNYPISVILGYDNTMDDDKEQSLLPTIDISKTSPDPAEFYGGKTFWMMEKSGSNYKGFYVDPDVDPEYRKISKYPAFSVDGGTTHFYSDIQDMTVLYGSMFMPVVAFPNVGALKSFLADWGILYCTNLDSAKNDPNDVVQNPDYPTDTPWGGTPSDPDAQPTAPWYNPTTPTDPVNPNPKDPGDDPAPDVEDIPDINITGNCYLLSRLTMNLVEKWLLGDEFLNDSSNVFTDKLSAINAATVFPFDLAVHDPVHTETVSGINIAGATKTLNGVKSISQTYNNCIDGGTLIYGDDWTAATPSYNAFLNTNYTVNIPCLGSVQIPPSACVGRKLVLKYYIDLISGGATAVVYSYPTGAFNDGFVDSGFIVFSGGCQLGQPVPLYSSNYTQRQLAIATSTISAIFAPLTGGNSFTPSVSNTAQMQNGFIQKSAGSSAAMGAAGAAGIAVGAAKYLGNIATAGIKSAIQNPLEFNLKGSYGAGNAWSMGLRASLTISYQIPTQPNNYQYIMGQSAAQRGRLKKFTGANANPTRGGLNYVECSATKLSINRATETELEMIQNTLSNGIFI